MSGGQWKPLPSGLKGLVFGTLKKLKTAVWNFFSDDCFTLGASIAYFTTLSLAPLLVIMLAIAGFMGNGAQEELVTQINNVVGTQAAEAVRAIIQNADTRQQEGALSAVLGIIMLILSASGVFNQLQKSMNRIWDVPERPGHEIVEWFRKRILSIGMVVAIGFVLLVSTAVNAAMHHFLPGDGMAWKAFDLLVSFGIFTLLFGAMFKILPDVIIGWRDVWLGGALTAALFTAGQFAIGKYLGYSSVGSSYGAAGSLVVLLVWVYYASLTVLLGTEMTEVYANSLRPVEWSDDPKEKLKGRKESDTASS